jgi:hypothetical protein
VSICYNALISVSLAVGTWLPDRYSAMEFTLAPLFQLSGVMSQYINYVCTTQFSCRMHLNWKATTWPPHGQFEISWVVLICRVILGMRGHCKFVYKCTGDDVENTSICGCAMQGSGNSIPVPFDILYTRMSLTSAANITKFMYQLGILLLQEDPISIRNGGKISSPAK